MSWKFNPPPEWPVPSDNWFPPPGWAPDPSWPAAPPGWEFWVRQEEAATPESAPGWVGPEPAGPPTGGTSPHPPPYQPPPGGYRPPVRPGRPAGRRHRGWAVGAAALAAVLLTCSGALVAVFAWDRATSNYPPQGPPDIPVAQGGWHDCDEAPNICNAGPVRDGGELVWGVSYIEDWNMHTVAGNTVPMRQIMTGLAPSTGSFQPDGTWEWNLDLLVNEPVQTGEKPDTYEYEIQPGARWSDGTPITVDDFVFRWRHSSGVEEHCVDCFPASSLGYDRIAEVSGDDGGKLVTVTLHEDRSYPEWWSMFTALYPAHRAEEEGFDLDTPEGMGAASAWFAGTLPDWSGGPWQVSYGDLQTEVVLEPNPNWYGTGPALDRLVFQVLDDYHQATALVEGGQIDGFGPALDPGPPPAASPDLLSHIGSSYSWDHLDINLEREWMDDAALRRAIFTAVDLNQIIEVVYRDLQPDAEIKRNHLLPPDSPYYQDYLSGTGQGTGDTEQAHGILTDAGYEIQGGVLTLDGEQVGPLVLQTSEGNPRRALVAELMSDHLADIGLVVDVELDLLANILEHDREFDLVLYGWTGSPLFANSGFQYWHSDSLSNYGRYANDAVDELVDAATHASDLDRAAGHSHRATELVVADAYVLPIAHTPQQTVVSAQFRHIRPQPGWDMFANSYEWGLGA